MPVLFFARSPHDRNQRDAIFRAIGDPTRREILSLLRGVWRTVGEIAGNFCASRPAISKRLRAYCAPQV